MSQVPRQDTESSARSHLERALADLSDLKRGLEQGVILATTDARGRITEVNQAFVSISGYSREELVGQDHRIVNSGVHPRSFFQDMWATIQSGSIWRGEICNRAKDGHHYWVDTVIVPHLDAEGRPERYLAIRMEVTKRKQAELMLQESERLLKAMAEGTGAYTGRDFLDHLVHHVRQALGVRWVMVGEALDTPPTRSRILAGRDGPRPVPPFEYTLAGTPCEGVMRDEICFHPQGVQRRFPEDGILQDMGAESYLGLPVRDRMGRVRGHLAVMDEWPMASNHAVLSVLKAFAARVGAELERIQAEGALQTSEARLTLALDAANAGLWELDLETDRVYCSARVHDLLGLRYGAFPSTRREWLRRLHPEDQRAFAQVLGNHMTGELPMVRTQFRIRHENGEYLWVKCRGQVVARDGNGRPSRVVGLVTDFTEERRREEALRETQKLESLGLLASEVSHDFNNFLLAMWGHAELAMNKVEEGKDPTSSLQTLQGVITQCRDLVRQLLDYSGRGAQRLEPVDMNTLLREMAHLLSVSIPKTVRLVVEGRVGLPRLRGDASQLRQVVLNLVTNAADAIGSGPGTIRLSLAHENLGKAEVWDRFSALDLLPGGFIVLQVSDTGCGMDEATKRRIFEPFFTTKKTGRGLGLAAMQGILRGHGGALEVESAPGRGTTFRVYFPVSTGEESRSAS